MEDYNSDDRCDQNNDNEELNNMMLFEKEFRVAGKQNNKSPYGKSHINIIISPLTVHRYIVDEESIVQDKK